MPPISAFHADNDSEYINSRVASMLEKLQITELTKSRARQTKDNALLESKNGSVLRKQLGYTHIPGDSAASIHHFNDTVLNQYLNFHRPCFFPSETANEGGIKKTIQIYRHDDARLKTEIPTRRCAIAQIGNFVPNARLHLKRIQCGD